ncbi:hypothetical protein H8U31_001268 [Salmonella enterica]|nr:hypothetical protein [Salmonella enterica]
MCTALWILASWATAQSLGVIMCWLLQGHKALSFITGFAIVGFMWLVIWLMPISDVFH